MRIPSVARLLILGVPPLAAVLAIASPGVGAPVVRPVATQRVAASAATSAETDAKVLAWPQIGFDSGHSGYNPGETTISAQNVASLALLWATPTDNTAQGLVAANGVLYGESSDLLYALNPKTGAVRWSIGGMNTNARAPAVAGTRVLAACNVPSQGSGLCAYEAKNGAMSWSNLATCFSCGLVSTPAVVKGLVYAENNSITTYYNALSVKTGNTVWVTTVPNHCNANGSATADPIAGGRAFYTIGCLGSDNHTSLCAYNAKNGTPGWCTELSFPGCGAAATLGVSEAGGVLVANVAYSGSCPDAQLIALDAKTGAQGWAVKMPGNALGPTQPAIANGVVYDLVGGNNLEAFSAKNGNLLWTQKGVANFGQGISIANGVAYTLCGGTAGLCAFNATTGAILWSSGTGGGAAGSVTTPVILNGVVYASCGTADFCAFGLSKQNRRR
jgi:outer membrane protein assembly factor BamB